jgi:hypothetical protein
MLFFIGLFGGLGITLIFNSNDSLNESLDNNGHEKPMLIIRKIKASK